VVVMKRVLVFAASAGSVKGAALKTALPLLALG
jgi:hypothetical protein